MDMILTTIRWVTSLVACSERHSRERVSVLCTPYGADDGSEQRSRIIQACDYFENTTMLSDFGVASKIAELGAHIAVDLMAHTTTYALAFLPTIPVKFW